ncbi:type VI secretion system baseplate subunit TssE [Candidatus Poribacteria bacterium]|nr:type VI secretion system baseplate subunit TssE [Candidatus Poribacteria bacterium]
MGVCIRPLLFIFAIYITMDVGLLEGILGKFFSGEPIPNRGGRVQSIREHLSILLNTRRGSVPHLPDYGLPDSMQVSIKDRLSISKFGRDIQETVKKYEPRLMNVRVKPIEQEPETLADFRLGFLLEAKVINQNARFRAFFTTSGSAEIEDTK